MNPKPRNKYRGGNIDELAKPKLIKRESKVPIKKESVEQIGKSNNYKLNKKLIPNNITINNNKQNKNNKFSETQYSSKRNNPMIDYKISNKNKISNNRNNSHSGSKNNSYYIKQNNKNFFFEEIPKKSNINNNYAKKKKFNNIDEPVILIQRCFRQYLNKIHNKNSELMKMINERKKNILHNFNDADKLSIFENKNNNVPNYENKIDEINNNQLNEFNYSNNK